MTRFGTYIICNEGDILAWIFLNINVFYQWPFAVTVEALYTDHLVDQMVAKQQNNALGR